MSFLTPDPAGNRVASPANPQSWDQYACVRNNPATLVDPFGLDPGDLNDCSTSAGTVYCQSDGVTVTGVGGTIQTVVNVSGAGGIINPSWSPTPIGSIIGAGGPRPAPSGGSGGGGGGAPNNATQPDNKSCASRLAAGIQKNTGVTPTNLQYTGTVGGHANYSFDVADPTGFQRILNQNMPWPWAGPFDEGHRYGIIQSTHILDPLNGSYSGHTDLFNGHSILAPLHWIVDVGIGHIPGVHLDFGCKAGS